MAQDIKPPQTSTDILMNEATTQPSDRAKRINSLHRSIDDISQEENRKRLQISNEIDTLTKQQKKLKTQINLQSDDFIHETAKSYDTVTKSLGETIQNLAIGVKKITADTARATTSAISQYGKAVSEDISINKTNTIAMSLAQATPIYGYFAAKFMETDVFKSATNKIKENIGGAVSSGLRAVGSKIGIGKKAKVGAIDESKIPSAQTGGYVKKGGLVNVHAGEIVAPIEKIQKDQRTHQKDLVEMFMDNLKEVSREKPWQEDLTENIKDMRAALIGSQDKMKIALQKTLTEHPVFSKLMLANEVFQTALVKPIRWLFAVRGGYGGEARKASRSTNVFERMVQLMILSYTRSMPKLDAIAYYNKVSAETLAGKKLKAPKEDLHTKFSKIKSWFGKKKKKEDKEEEAGMILSYIAGDKGTLERMKEEGITKLSDLLPWNFAKKIGATKENIRARADENLPGFISKRFAKEPERKTAQQRQEDIEKQWAEDQTPKTLGEMNQAKIDAAKLDEEKIADDISALRKVTESEQEEKQKDSSPENTMAEGISSLQDIEETSVKVTKETRKDEKKSRKLEASWRNGVGKRIKKMGSGIWKWILIGLSVIKTTFATVWGGISSFIGLFAGGMAAPIVTGLMSILGSATLWGVIGAGLVGYGIGTMINRYLIDPIIQWWNNKEDYKKKKTKEELKGLTKGDLSARLKAKTAEGKYKGTEKLALRADIKEAQKTAKYKQKQRLTARGMFGASINVGEDETPAIYDAQSLYIQRNEKKYLQYSREERRRLRVEWLKQSGGYRDRNLGESPSEYGLKREESFFKYLTKKGEKLTDEQRQQSIQDIREGKSRRKPTPFPPKKPAISPKSSISAVGGGSGIFKPGDVKEKGLVLAAAYWRDPETGKAWVGIGRAKPRTRSSNSFTMAARRAKLMARGDLADQTGRSTFSRVIAKAFKGGSAIPDAETILPPWNPKDAPTGTQAGEVGYSKSTAQSPETKIRATQIAEKKKRYRGVIIAAAYWRDPKTGKAWVGIGRAKPFSGSSSSISMAGSKAALMARGDLADQTGLRRFSRVIIKHFKEGSAIPDAESILPPWKEGMVHAPGQAGSLQPMVSTGSQAPEEKAKVKAVAEKKKRYKGAILAAAYWRDPKTGKAWVGIGRAKPRTGSSNSFSMAVRKAKLLAKGDLVSQTGRQGAYSGIITKTFKGGSGEIPDAETVLPPWKAGDVPSKDQADTVGYLKSTTAQQSTKAKMAQTPTEGWKKAFEEAKKEYNQDINNANQQNQETNISNVSNSAVSSSSQNINAGGGDKIQTGGGFSSGPGMGASVVHSNIR